MSGSQILVRAVNLSFPIVPHHLASHPTQEKFQEPVLCCLGRGLLRGPIALGKHPHQPPFLLIPLLVLLGATAPLDQAKLHVAENPNKMFV